MPVPVLPLPMQEEPLFRSSDVESITGSLSLIFDSVFIADSKDAAVAYEEPLYVIQSDPY